MKHQELNEFILNYITENKTKSAILLTAPWGTGKSYYIENELKPFLKKEENGEYKCVVVSLYGLKDLFEVSRALFLENSPKFMSTDSKKANVGKFFAKTVLKGVISKFGVDFSTNKEDIQKVFEAIDLTGKLVVFEDLERSSIDVIDVLGYVNNLVEQDGVKVLIVANEDEIKQYELGDEKKEITGETHNELDNKSRQFAEKNLEYLKVKEKTISDTIFFEKDFKTAIPKIIEMFENEVLKKFSGSKNTEEILNIMDNCKTSNLRSLIFACQKTVDILKKLDEKYLSDYEFIQVVFYGTLYFSLKQKTGKMEKWGQEKYFSTILGNRKYPLFKFCYDYITSQKFNFDFLEETYNSFKDYLLYSQEKSNRDEDICTLKEYYIRKEEDILTALNNITTRLEKPEDISFYQYGTIAAYSVIFSDLLDYDTANIERLLIKNLEGREQNLQIEYVFHNIFDNEATQQQKEKYELLKKKMIESLRLHDTIFTNFEYKPEQSGDFLQYVLDYKSVHLTKNSFANQLDLERLAEMFRRSTAEQKQDIRGAIFTMYNLSNIKTYLKDDLESIKQLLAFVKRDSSKNVGDRIQKMQYEWFEGNLTMIIDKLS